MTFETLPKNHQKADCHGPRTIGCVSALDAKQQANKTNDGDLLLATELMEWRHSFPDMAYDELSKAFLFEAKGNDAIDYAAVRRRVRERSLDLSVSPPINLLSEDRAPHKGFLRFAVETVTSLDWFVLGKAQAITSTNMRNP